MANREQINPTLLIGLETAARAATKRDWRQGKVLLTAQTKKWSQREVDEANEQEHRTVFADFHEGDEGRGRQRIAFCERKDDAAYIAFADPEMILTMIDEIRWLRQQLNENCIPQILRKERAAVFNDALQAAAITGYVTCGETHHVTLGEKVRVAILSIEDEGPRHG